MSYTPKQLKFDDECRGLLISGVEKISKAVKSTFGPMGNTVIIESPEHTHGLTVTKDGVTVAKSISLIDPVENIAARMVRQAAERTATSAGDGTSNSVVLSEALVKAGTKYISNGVNKTQVLRELVTLTNSAVEFLKGKSKDVTEEKIIDVATISSNNDTELGGIISQVYKEVGKDGVVTVDKSQNNATYFETTMGVKVDRGYSTHHFINDHTKDECILEDVHILVADTEISNLLQLENILGPLTKGKSLLIIAECSQNVSAALALNVAKNGIKVCTIQPPSFGYRQHELMSDIALSVGATYFSEKTGDDLSLINWQDLGHADRITVGKNSTVIVKSEGMDEEAISERVEQLRGAKELSTATDSDKSFIDKRIASLTGGIGVVYAGGDTDLEQKELYDRIDDAVRAVRSALEEGILPGGGLPLYFYSKMLDETNDLPFEETDAKVVALKIMAEALKAPLTTILENADLTFDEVYKDGVEKWGWGYNLKTSKMEDLVKSGVIDPTKVTRSALQNAVSVAVTILSTNAIVTMAREGEDS